MDRLSDLEALIHLYQGKPDSLRGLLQTIMDQQPPSENVSYGKPLTGVDHVLHQQVMDQGLGRQQVYAHPVNWGPVGGPTPRRQSADMTATPLPMSVQMRSAPYLDEMGALLDRRAQ